MQRAANVLLVGSLEACNLGFFLGESPDEASAGEVLLRLCGDVREHSLNPLETFVNSCAELLHYDRSNGQRDKSEQRKARADADHEWKRGDSEKNRVEAVHDGRAEYLANGRQIVRRAGHDVARAVRLVEGRRLTLKVGK